VSFSTAMLKEA